MDNILPDCVQDVRSTLPEEKLFGRFFKGIDCCRSLMREKRVVASGNALIQTLRPCFTWVPSEMDLFVSRSSLGNEGLLEWNDFLFNEGYSLASKPRDQPLVEGYVSTSSSS